MAYELASPACGPPALRILKSNNPSISLTPPAAIIRSVLQQSAELHAKKRDATEPSASS